MGLRGPPPTPTKLLEARGSWRAKARKGEPRPPTAKPACPQWLPKEAKAEWRRQVKELEQQGTIALLDRAFLTAFCEAWAEYVEACKLIQKHGMIIKTTDGNLIQNPVVSIRNKAYQRMLAIGKEFGFSPSARARLSIQPPSKKEENPNDKARFFRIHHAG